MVSTQIVGFTVHVGCTVDKVCGIQPGCAATVQNPTIVLSRTYIQRKAARPISLSPSSSFQRNVYFFAHLCIRHTAIWMPAQNRQNHQGFEIEQNGTARNRAIGYSNPNSRQGGPRSSTVSLRKRWECRDGGRCALRSGAGHTHRI